VIDANDTKNRPILLVANSSWYLLHYRKLLLEILLQQGQHVLALSPVDSATPELSRLLIQIPWRIHRSTDANPLVLGVSLLRMVFLVRAIKPRLVHSHTLKANLLAVVVSAFFGVPCVLSFAGMGRLSKAKGPSRMAFLWVLRTIAFFAVRQRTSRWRWRLAPRRTTFIFQNPIDQQIFQAALPIFREGQTLLIAGSGVPARYLQQSLLPLSVNHWCIPPANPPRCELLFCGRLLRSKGIGTFLELASLMDCHSFTVFGGVDPSSKDSLLNSDLPALQRHHLNVTFAGSQTDPLLQLRANFPVLLVPSNYGEGLPRAIVEALALGIPVISSRSATCGIFQDSTVYIADGDSPDDYLRCFDRLIADHSSARLQFRLEAGRTLVEQQLSEQAVVERTIEVYQSMQSVHPKSYLLNKDNARLQHWLAQ
jgi:glycosyltransferase involved in cell wall biosynthesis